MTAADRAAEVLDGAGYHYRAVYGGVVDPDTLVAALMADPDLLVDLAIEAGADMTAERDLLAGIIRGIGGTVEQLDHVPVHDENWTHDWTFAGHVDGAPLTAAEAEAVRRIIGEEES